jgi:pimeloyl-ACP methyl ester carboxylesterase
MQQTSHASGPSQRAVTAGEPSPLATSEHEIEANGLRIHYVEAGAGEPLLLLHGGMASTGAAWAGYGWGWVDHLGAFARHFRVLAPDTRGHGRTRNPGVPMSYALLADDWAAFIAALGLERPLVCGFSDGGIAATVMAIRHPGVARALVNIAGYDVFNPQAHGFVRLRRRMGGSPDATAADPDYFASKSAEQDWFKRMVRDLDEAQGEGAWRSLLCDVFPMWTQPMTYTLADWATITIPTLVLVGDRDYYCTPEEGVAAYRALPHGELCILPHLDHLITPLVRDVALDFLLRQRDATPG